MGSLALGGEFGAGWEVWRWVGGLALSGNDFYTILYILALGGEFGAGWGVWRWVGSLALGGRFGAGWKVWRWVGVVISTYN